MNQNKRSLTYRRIVLISLLIVAGVIIGGRILFYKPAMSITEDTISLQEGMDCNRDVLIQLDKRCAGMSKDGLLRYKSSCENTLEFIRLKLDSDSLNPEERHQNILAKRVIEQELEIVKKHLQK